ncbi:hypothetical protein KUF71_010431 [Frankliniella fusca]|uniref:Uncharacterized protein n=1 Tax=Frankliniella fusca TaxID=407009 RepID=A0AAE1LI98_9NEOP|nr:hypothetical protein KUF71_010431 [Frankliniella fusca]
MYSQWSVVEQMVVNTLHEQAWYASCDLGLRATVTGPRVTWAAMRGVPVGRTAGVNCLTAGDVLTDSSSAPLQFIGSSLSGVGRTRGRTLSCSGNSAGAIDRFPEKAGCGHARVGGDPSVG